MPTAKEALSELVWRHDRLGEAVVWYTHRGAPGDRRAVRGSEILALERSFFTIVAPEGKTSIPYHRIQRVEVAGRPYWDRHPPTLGDLEEVRLSRRHGDEQI